MHASCQKTRKVAALDTCLELVIYQRRNLFAQSSENPLKVRNYMASFLSQSSSDDARENINKTKSIHSSVVLVAFRKDKLVVGS